MNGSDKRFQPTGHECQDSPDASRAALSLFLASLAKHSALMPEVRAVAERLCQQLEPVSISNSNVD